MTTIGADTLPDELYRRCPGCLDRGPGAPCPTCEGERFIMAEITADELYWLSRTADELRRIVASIMQQLGRSNRSRPEDRGNAKLETGCPDTPTRPMP